MARGQARRQEQTMWTLKRQTALARLMIVGGFVCGFVGLIVGVIDRSWKLGVVGWFAGGTLLAALAIAILIDSYQRIRQVDLNLEQAER